MKGQAKKDFEEWGKCECVMEYRGNGERFFMPCGKPTNNKIKTNEGDKFICDWHPKSKTKSN